MSNHVFKSLHVHDIFVNMKTMSTKTPWSHSMFYLPLWGKQAPQCPISWCLWEIYSLTNSFLERSDYLQYTELICLISTSYATAAVVEQFVLLCHCNSQGGNLCLLNHPQFISLGQRIFAYNFIISSASVCVYPYSEENSFSASLCGIVSASLGSKQLRQITNIYSVLSYACVCTLINTI